MKILTAILVGGVAGAAAMLLFAPRSGEETRAKILGKASDVRGHTTETVGHTTETIKDKLSQARSKADELKEDIQTKAVELRY
jgi:gas vesicle protein